MDRLELWLITAIGAIFVVRLFLEITGYPSMGGKSLHVAHVLWGGLLMAVGMIILFIFLGRTLQSLGVLAGGIGFGLFVDEVGKFVTRDNNYFFQPSVAIMYTVFVVLYVVARWVLTSTRYSETEYLVNAINELKEVPIGRVTEDEKKVILFSLEKSGSKDQLAAGLKDVVIHIDTTAASRTGLFVHIRDGFYQWYRRLTAHSWFSKAVAGFFILQVLGSASIVLALLFDEGEMMAELENFGFSDWAVLASNTICAIFITWGVLRLRRSRLEAYKMFERSLLVQIFIGEVFLFYSDEFWAIPGFIFYLLLLIAIRFMMQREKAEFIGAAIAS